MIIMNDLGGTVIKYKVSRGIFYIWGFYRWTDIVCSTKFILHVRSILYQLGKVLLCCCLFDCSSDINKLNQEYDIQNSNQRGSL